jgi:hypothetical protein
MMTDAEVLAALSDFDAFWLTIKGEAESEPIQGQVGVACVIRNRVLADLGHDALPDWWGEGYKGVCFARRQFTCWDPDYGGKDYQRMIALARIIADDYAMRSTLAPFAIDRQIRVVAEHVMNGDFLDNTRGATQYLTRTLFETKPPVWARNAPHALQLGSQVFLPA